MITKTLAALDSGSHFDCCVIGAGPSGITVARRLAFHGKRVILLEGGDWQPTEQSAELYQGEVVGDAYFKLEEPRLRYFGGTSGHWGGVCRPLDAADFEPKPGFDNAVWPIRKTTLDPFLKDAAQILEIEPSFDDSLLSESGVKRLGFRYSPPVRFGDKYKDDLIASDRIVLCLNANLLSFEPADGEVLSADFANYEKEKATIRADIFILACGGIENSRLLLYGNLVSNGQLVKYATTLGRYWMEHPNFTVGTVVFFENAGESEGKYGLTTEMQRRLGILNCGLRVERMSEEDEEDFAGEIANFARRVSAGMAARLSGELGQIYRLRALSEQEPRSESRVYLSKDETDRFGIPRPALDWRKSAADLRTVRETALQFGRFVALEDIGRVHLNDWVLGSSGFPDDDRLGGNHHIGGTRMAAAPSDGILDENLKVFGQSNLYVCGSSVFPSGGHANPTLTIVQLALRLGDHLARQ